MNAQHHYSDYPWRNIFEKYFSDIINDQKTKIEKPGPYISISRDFGCMANNIARQLSKELTKRNKAAGINREWKWINKTILEESAKALDLSPSKIEYVFHSKKKTVMDEIIGAMSQRYYKSDKKIRNTIIEVIRNIAKTGYVIIVGRGGVAFANDNPASLHIKLTAPIEWRVDRISNSYKKTKSEALNYILEIDKERKFLIDSFMGFDTDLSIFDVVYNRKTLKENKIIASIINLLEMKKLI